MPGRGAPVRPPLSRPRKILTTTSTWRKVVPRPVALPCSESAAYRWPPTCHREEGAGQKGKVLGKPLPRTDPPSSSGQASAQSRSTSFSKRGGARMSTSGRPVRSIPLGEGKSAGRSAGEARCRRGRSTGEDRCRPNQLICGRSPVPPKSLRRRGPKSPMPICWRGPDRCERLARRRCGRLARGDAADGRSAGEARTRPWAKRGRSSRSPTRRPFCGRRLMSPEPICGRSPAPPKPLRRRRPKSPMPICCRGPSAVVAVVVLVV